MRGEDRRAFPVRPGAAPFRTGVERDGADDGKGAPDAFEYFGLGAFGVAFDEVDPRQTLFARESLDPDRARLNALALGEDRRIGAGGGERETDVAVFIPDRAFKSLGSRKTGDISLKTGESGGIGLEAEDFRAVARADMRELPDIGADVEDDAVGGEGDMPSDAVFPFEAVEPRRPTLAIKLPAKRRGDADSMSFNDHENALVGVQEPNDYIAVKAKRREGALAQELEALGERELQRIGPDTLQSAIRAASKSVTPREGSRP